MKNWYGKKVVSAIISLAMVLSLVPGAVMAEEIEASDGNAHCIFPYSKVPLLETGDIGTYQGEYGAYDQHHTG